MEQKRLVTEIHDTIRYDTMTTIRFIVGGVMTIKLDMPPHNLVLIQSTLLAFSINFIKSNPSTIFRSD